MYYILIVTRIIDERDSNEFLIPPLVAWSIQSLLPKRSSEGTWGFRKMRLLCRHPGVSTEETRLRIERIPLDQKRFPLIRAVGSPDSYRMAK